MMAIRSVITTVAVLVMAYGLWFPSDHIAPESPGGLEMLRVDSRDDAKPRFQRQTLYATTTCIHD